MSASAASRRYSPQEKETLTARALALLQQGHSRTEAADALGLGKSTLYDWLAPRQAEADLAQRNAAMLLLDETGNSQHTRLRALLYCRNFLWACWTERLARLDTDAMRMLAAIDRLDRMLDRLTGGLYFLPKDKKKDSAEQPADLPEIPEDFPAEIPAAENNIVQSIDNKAIVEEEALPEESIFPAKIPTTAAPATQRPPVRKKGAPIPPGWGFKRGKR